MESFEALVKCRYSIRKELKRLSAMVYDPDQCDTCYYRRLLQLAEKVEREIYERMEALQGLVEIEGDMYVMNHGVVRQIN